uniref:hypothetical protein n=1 Tax=Prevotella sp. TaxID=59823 RepID=UPI004029BA09
MMKIIRWTFDKLVIAEIYYLDNNSRDIDVEKIYRSMFGVTMLFVYGIGIFLGIYIPALVIPVVLSFAYPFVQERILKRKSYVEYLIELYKSMPPEGKKRLAKQGWYYRCLPILGYAIILIMFFIFRFLKPIHP